MTSKIQVMTVPTPARETRIVPIAGRSLVVRQPNEAQTMLMINLASQLQRASVPIAEKLEASNMMFKILKSLVVESDREFLVDQVAEGNVELMDMITFVTAFNSDKEDDKPKVRRGRAPAKR